MKRLVFALLILFCGNDMSAQTYTKEVCVRFPVASSVLNPNFGDNAASLAEIVKFLTDVHLTSSLKKHAFYNLLINNILYLCVT